MVVGTIDEAYYLFFLQKASSIVVAHLVTILRCLQVPKTLLVNRSPRRQEQRGFAFFISIQSIMAMKRGQG
jgi:hypothetical protein